MNYLRYTRSADMPEALEGEVCRSTPSRFERVLFFRTLPDRLNSNARLEAHIVDAYRRVFTRAAVFRVSPQQCVPAIESIRPDLIIGLGSVVFDWIDWAAIYRAAKQSGAVVVYWLFDDPYEFDLTWKIEAHTDWIFSSDKASLAYYADVRCSHLPLAADLQTHFHADVEQSSSGKRFDIFFCGYGYENRRRLMFELAGVLRRYKSSVRGANWPEELPFCLNQKVDSNELPLLYATSSVVINVGRDLNLANRINEIVPSTPGPRLFEAAASGACQLCFLETSEVFDYYDNESEIVTFSTVSGFEVALQRLLDEGKASQIGKRSQMRTKREHLYDHRVALLHETVEKKVRP